MHCVGAGGRVTSLLRGFLSSLAECVKELLPTVGELKLALRISCVFQALCKVLADWAAVEGFQVRAQMFTGT